MVFCFGSVSSLFLELFLHWSPVACWAATDLGSASFSILSFCLFILFMGLSRQEYWSGLPFPSPVDHILSDLSTMTLPSWLARHSMPHSFIELDKAVVHVIRLASFLWLWFQSVCPLMPSLSAYCLTWVSLTLDVGYLFMAAPAKCSRCSLPWTWGLSSQPPLLTLDMGYVLSATPAPTATDKQILISISLYPDSCVTSQRRWCLNHSRGLPTTFCRDNGVQGKSKKQLEHKLLTSCPCIPYFFHWTHYIPPVFMAWDSTITLYL